VVGVIASVYFLNEDNSVGILTLSSLDIDNPASEMVIMKFYVLEENT